jgi:hypothetical protein
MWSFKLLRNERGGANGKVKFGVLGMGFEIGGTAKFSSEQIHKVKLSLKPVQVNRDGSITELEISKVPATTKSEDEVSLSRKPIQGS